jgi:chitinase
VDLSAPSALAVEVSFASVDGTASNGTDYAAVARTLVFPPGTTAATATVQVNGDTSFEGNETFELRLTNAVHAELGDAYGVATILNDDNVPTIVVFDATGAEGDAGVSNFVFAVVLSQPFSGPVSVSFATSNGTAAAGSDYAHTSGVVVIPAGQTLGSIAVAVHGDTDHEANETLLLLLATPTNATLSTTQASGTINNDDPMPAVSLADLAAAEGNAGESNFLIRVELSRASAFAVTAGYTTVAGSAATGTDFTAASGRIVVPAGATNATIAIAVQGDTVYETNELFEVRLTNAANATLADTQAVVTILNDDALPALSIADASAAEGDAGTAPVTFTVSAPNASAFTVTVAYATANGTASNGTDYSAVSGTLVLLPGATSATVDVSVNGDTTLEPDETFVITLSNATQAAIADSTATGTILNDDPVPEMTLSGGSENEGDAGTMSLVFTAYLSFPIPFPVTVNYATANSGATAGSDYVAASGTLVFPAGVDTATASVTIIGDTMYEAGENVRLNLSSPTNATLAQTFATGTILNDDSLPAVSIQDVAADEGNTGSTGFVFVVELSNPSAYPVTVDFATADDSAQAGGDYTAIAGSLLFGPGTTVQTIAVSVLGDTMAESNESFHVNLDNASGAFVTDPYGFGTIVNDDGLPTGYSAFAAQIPDAAQRGVQMDPDGDGYPNLLEYVTGGNPNVPDTIAHLDASRAGPVLSLRFSRATNAVDATLYVEGGIAVQDGAVWTPIATNAAGAWGVGGGPVTETGDSSPMAVSVADTAPASSNRFLRLRVVLP